MASFMAQLIPVRQPDVASIVSPSVPGQNPAQARRHSLPSPSFAAAGRAPDEGLPPAAATPTAPAIDMESARAAARAYATEMQPGRALDPPKPQLVVEAAIARATEPDSVIETRGPNGEHIVQTRDLRCVTPFAVPHYMTGMTVPAQCMKRKS